RSVAAVAQSTCDMPVLLLLVSYLSTRAWFARVIDERSRHRINNHGRRPADSRARSVAKQPGWMLLVRLGMRWRRLPCHPHALGCQDHNHTYQFGQQL